MDKKLQIFISSTYTDLIEERQAAVEVILKAHHIPAGMELFAAGNDSQLAVIKRWIDESDIFMLILGGRYGSIEPKTGNSYIQLEYEYAVQKSIPVFALVLTNDFLNRKTVSLATNGGDFRGIFELDNPQKYQEFKNQVRQRMCKICDNINDIKLGIFESLIEFTSDPYYELTGWVPGINMKQLEKRLSTFSDENYKLKSEIENLKQAEKHLRDTLARKCKIPQIAYNIHLLEALEKSSLKSAFRIKVDNPLREVRVKELVEEELTSSGQKTFRLVASSGANYLNAQGKVWQVGLGDAVVKGEAQLTVVLESPFSEFAKTRALANRVTHHQWQEKITVERLKELSQKYNVTIKVTEDAVNCSLFFTSNSVFYDPYLWAKPTPALRTENNFWVFEFRKQEPPNKDYECYSLLEKHFDFLLERSTSLEEFLGENNENFNKNTEQFQKALSSLLEKQ